MKVHQFLITAWLVNYACAILSNRGTTPGVLQVPFERSISELQRRDSTVNVANRNKYFNYIVNSTVGTPPQFVTLSLDTGSSDMVILNKESTFCEELGGDICSGMGYYNPNRSSTYVYQSSNFVANYGFADQGQGSGLVGDVATDTYSIGGATIKNQQFAVAYSNVTIATSILGLSYAAGENQVHTRNPQPAYDNLPLSLVKSGAINLALFSLWKNDLSGHNGNILFGGVDTDKYTGNLTTLAIQSRPDYPEILAFDVILSGVKLSGNSSFPPASTGSAPAVLDCGSLHSLLPDEFAQPIFDQFGVTYFQANDTSIVDCSLARKNYTIDFIFEGITISAPIKGFVVQYNDDEFCSFGIVAAGQRHALLGDNFLSNAYTVFDLTNDQISFGKRNFASRSEKIVAIAAGGVGAGEASSGTPSTSNPPSTTSPPSAGNTPSDTTTSTAPTTSETKKSSASRFTAVPYYLAILAFAGIAPSTFGFW